MNEYTASNGVEVVIHSNGRGSVGPVEVKDRGFKSHVTTYFEPGMIAALREFFAAELGGWVDPETSALVILDVTRDDQKGRYVSVFLNGTMHGLFENGPWGASDVGQIAARYFAAHRIYPPVDPS